jgi:Rps23 Pro-64 3,4-dihydroxylase Tpa1-like proline 4-hydroxylase
MLNLSKFDTNKLKKEFSQGYPFPFIVIDNFLETDFLKQVENDVRNLEEKDWYDKTSSFSHINSEADSYVQSKKNALNIRNQIPERPNMVFDLFSSPEIVNFIEEVTGIKELEVDTSFMGGGIHRTKRDGRLAIHADFNIHPVSNKYRRINALLYLNSEWKPEFNGELELWSKDMKKCVEKIPPLFNRLVIFRITDDAYHGHPETWKAPLEYPRMSFAFYYYTQDRPEEEKAPFHWALWQKRNNIDY